MAQAFIQRRLSPQLLSSLLVLKGASMALKYAAEVWQKTQASIMESFSKERREPGPQDLRARRGLVATSLADVSQSLRLP